VLPRFYSVEVEMDELFRRTGIVEFSGRQIRCLSAEDLLLGLCLHAAKHAWVRLSWLCDIAATVSTQNINYGRFYERVEKLGVARVVAMGFWLITNLLGTALPPEAAENMARDTAVPVISRGLLPLIMGTAEYDTESPAYFRLMLRVRERRRDQLRFLWRLAVTPGEGEWSLVRLPEVLFPMYRVVRAGRLAGKIFWNRR